MCTVQFMIKVLFHFTFVHKKISLFLYNLLKRLFFIYWITFVPWLKISCPCVWGLFMDFLFCYIGLFFCLHSDNTLFGSLLFIISSGVSVSSETLFFFFQVFLANIGLLHLNMYFWMFLISTKKVCWNFD